MGCTTFPAHHPRQCTGRRGEVIIGRARSRSLVNHGTMSTRSVPSIPRNNASGENASSLSSPPLLFPLLPLDQSNHARHSRLKSCLSLRVALSSRASGRRSEPLSSCRVVSRHAARRRREGSVGCGEDELAGRRGRQGETPGGESPSLTSATTAMHCWKHSESPSPPSH